MMKTYIIKSQEDLEPFKTPQGYHITGNAEISFSLLNCQITLDGYLKITA